MLKDIGDSKSNYEFASGGIGDFMQNFSQPLQETGVNEMSDLSMLDQPEDEIIEEQEPERIMANAQVSKASGKLLAIITDTSLASVLALAAKDTDVSKYKASPVEREELQAAFTEYTRLRGTDIPPGLALFLAILAIYGSKIPTVLSSRKQSNQKDGNHENS